jgi:putative ABC transport system substrate-binding protein
MRRRDFLAGLWGATVTSGVQAQQAQKVHRIAIVVPAMPVAAMMEHSYFGYSGAFLEKLRQLGYREKTNLVVARYSGEGRTEHYAELAREVVDSKPDVILVLSSRLARHFKQATTTIPIVVSTSDPIAQGLVPSLARPGGNITGVVVDAGIGMSEAKRLEVLQEAAPGATKIGFLAPRAVWGNPDGVALREVAQQRGIPLVGALLESPVQEPEYRRLFAAMARERVDALIVSDTPENFAYRQIIIQLAGENRLPTVYPMAEFAKDGGLISWGIDFVKLFGHAADTVGKILSGAKPGEIPFYRATTVELVINLRTAKAQGIEMPASLLARADEVID